MSGKSRNSSLFLRNSLSIATGAKPKPEPESPVLVRDSPELDSDAEDDFETFRKNQEQAMKAEKERLAKLARQRREQKEREEAERRKSQAPVTVEMVSGSYDSKKYCE